MATHIDIDAYGGTVSVGDSRAVRTSVRSRHSKLRTIFLASGLRKSVSLS